jgi:hypothetical protein
MKPTKMRKRRTSWVWGIANSDLAGDLAVHMFFNTREEARDIVRDIVKLSGNPKFYVVRLEVSWDIKEKDRW